MHPIRSISTCPICGGGLCGVRVCYGPDPATAPTPSTSSPHGLIVCDECEAIWLQPDVSGPHQYADPELPRCPICSTCLWSPRGAWAGDTEVAALGWGAAIDPQLNLATDQDTT